MRRRGTELNPGLPARRDVGFRDRGWRTQGFDFRDAGFKASGVMGWDLTFLGIRARGLGTSGMYSVGGFGVWGFGAWSYGGLGFDLYHPSGARHPRAACLAHVGDLHALHVLPRIEQRLPRVAAGSGGGRRFRRDGTVAPETQAGYRREVPCSPHRRQVR